MKTSDTIAAISTPLGMGGIGIIRLSGPKATSYVDHLFQAKNKSSLSKMPSHQIGYGRLIDPVTRDIIDEVIVTIMRAPRSYTREDVVEINCHAGTVVLQAALKAVLTVGARLAEPGEFTKRAFLNGRIDLAQAEAVSNLIQAQTETAARVALQQLSGGLSEKIQLLRQEILSLLAQVEAAVDFSDEDIETLETNVIIEKTRYLVSEINDLLETCHRGKIISVGLNTVITGRTNVGKSSLLNILAKEDRAIVTPLPGTTRDVVEATINLEGVPVKLKDTAGIRDPQDEAEAAGVHRSRLAADQADLILLIFDGSEKLQDEDLEIIKNLAQQQVIIPIINKIDLPKRLNAKNISELFSFNNFIFTSTLTGQGLAELRQSIINHAHNSNNVDADVIVVNVRHEHALTKAHDALDETIKSFKSGYTEEILAQTLKEALEAVGEIVGASSYDDLLDEIFSQFCIGK